MLSLELYVKSKTISRTLILVAFTVLTIAGAAAGESLRFGPPPLEDPRTIDIPAGGEDQHITLADTEDAILRFPSQIVNHAVTVTGGRRVVVVGGHIEYRGTGSRALAFTRMPAGSIVFVEGMKIDVSGVPEAADAINVDGKEPYAPDVYIQNCVLTGIKGMQKGFHGDAFQFTGMVTTPPTYHRGELYLAHCEIDTSYQGAIVAKHKYHDLSQTHTNRIESVAFTYNTLSPYDGRLAYIYWTASAANIAQCNFTELNNVWMEPWTEGGLSIEKNHLWPGPTLNSLDPVTNTVTSSHSHVKGAIHVGVPPSSLIIGTPGADYSSPGYASPVPGPRRPEQ